MMNATLPKLELEKIIPLAKLPGLPQSLVRMLEISQDPANGPAEFAIPIETDLGLTGQVLQFVNSSYFGFAREISNIKMAILMIGVNAIKNFVIWSAFYSSIERSKYGPFYLKSLWQDSLRRALFAREFAKLLGMKDAETVFTAALLQDMAIPILAKELSHSYAKLFESRKRGQIRLSLLENQAFGWTHAQAASMIVRHWNLPDELANLIENHTAIDQFADKPEDAPDMVAVAMSALLPSVADPEWSECQQFALYYEKFIPGNNPGIVELLDQIDKMYELFAPILKLTTNAKLLVHYYNKATVLIS
jgi:HD-like signal output (HDOD) protein